MTTTTYTDEEQRRKAWAAELYRDLQAMKSAPRNSALKKYLGPKSELGHEWKVSLVSRAFREREAMNWGLEHLEGVMLSRIVSWMGDELTPQMVTKYLIKNENLNTDVLKLIVGSRTTIAAGASKETREATIIGVDKKFFTEEVFIDLFRQVDSEFMREEVVANKAKEVYNMPLETPDSWVRKTLGIE